MKTEGEFENCGEEDQPFATIILMLSLNHVLLLLQFL